MEVIWLWQRDQPSYKMMANFRRDHAAVLQTTTREFVPLCRELAPLDGSQVVIDGIILKADTNPHNIHTMASLERILWNLEKKIATHHRQMDEADAQAPTERMVLPGDPSDVGISGLASIISCNLAGSDSTLCRAGCALHPRDRR